MICWKTEMSLKLPGEREILSREILWGFRQIKSVPLRWLKVWVLCFPRVVEQIAPTCLSHGSCLFALRVAWVSGNSSEKCPGYIYIYGIGFNKREDLNAPAPAFEAQQNWKRGHAKRVLCLLSLFSTHLTLYPSNISLLGSGDALGFRGGTRTKNSPRLPQATLGLMNPWFEKSQCCFLKIHCNLLLAVIFFRDKKCVLDENYMSPFY